jgi:calcium-dependent protein kinase
MKQVDNLILKQYLGKDSFGDIYLTMKKGLNYRYSTKVIDRNIVDISNLSKYLKNELVILKQLNHPNITKLEEIKKTKGHYYIVMEYDNGDNLSDCLKKYMLKYKKPFPPEIVQYLMKQILDALSYFHSLGIIHRDLRLDNIKVFFDSANDKVNLNMKRARIKITGFSRAIQLGKTNVNLNDFTNFTGIVMPVNMDPIIFHKLFQRRDLNLGYDTKVDIWSIGTIFYEILIGKPAFNACNINDLIYKIDNVSYSIPINISKEAASFLNGMLQYDSKRRLSARELLNHPFLTKRVTEHNIKIKFRQNNNIIYIKDDRYIYQYFNSIDK